MPQQRTSYALIIETGAHVGLALPLTGELFTIGRELDNTLVLDSPQLSRYHARLRVSPAGTVLLEDLGSANGTFIEGALLSKARRLLPGEAFTLAGTVRLRLIEDESARGFAPPAQWTAPAVEPERLLTPGSAAPASHAETWIAPALTPALTPALADFPAVEAGAAHGPRLLYAVIGLLLLALCGALALSIYFWFAPLSFWQQVFTVLGLPFPAP